ncbi:hypothetical protein F4680DRAFT_214085 [Xylaria scruposa]|nr:hypothetical protein F4680DRAFT_214085 [Xylaria scruposa]
MESGSRFFDPLLACCCFSILLVCSRLVCSAQWWCGLSSTLDCLRSSTTLVSEWSTLRGKWMNLANTSPPNSLIFTGAAAAEQRHRQRHGAAHTRYQTSSKQHATLFFEQLSNLSPSLSAQLPTLSPIPKPFFCPPSPRWYPVHRPPASCDIIQHRPLR